MFDIGWTEMFAVVVIAVIVIGPKDLPGTLRTVGNWIGKVRAVGRDFQRGLDDMIRDSELDDVKKQIENVAKLDLQSEVEKTIDPSGTIKDAMAPVKLDADGEAAKKQQPDAEPKRCKYALVDIALHCGAIDTLNPVAGVREAVGEISVVR